MIIIDVVLVTEKALADHLSLVQGYFRSSVDAALDTLRQALGKNPFYKAPEDMIKEL